MRKRKQFNPLKQAQMLAKQSLKHSAIGCVAGKGPCQLIDLRANNILPVTETKLNLISSLRHKWSVFIAAFGIDHNDQYYMKSKEITVEYPVFQSEMVDTLNQEHLKLTKEFNPNHLISVGWIATPFIKEWEEHHAFNLLEKLGALSFTKDESNQIVEV